LCFTAAPTFFFAARFCVFLAFNTSFFLLLKAIPGSAAL